MLFKRLVLPSVVLLLAVAYPASSWAEFIARVITVHEGDRLTIRHDGRNETIYLKDVDCPAPKQSYGKQAKQATAAYVGNRQIVVRTLTRDRQGRTTAEILLPDGRNVGRELIKEGLAWWQRSGDPGLGILEELARASGKGLWSEPNPVPPWQWKTVKKSKRKFSD